MKEKTIQDGWSLLMKFGSEENLKKTSSWSALYEKFKILCRFRENNR